MCYLVRNPKCQLECGEKGRSQHSTQQELHNNNLGGGKNRGTVRNKTINNQERLMRCGQHRGRIDVCSYPVVWRARALSSSCKSVSLGWEHMREEEAIDCLRCIKADVELVARR